MRTPRTTRIRNAAGSRREVIHHPTLRCDSLTGLGLGTRRGTRPVARVLNAWAAKVLHAVPRSGQEPTRASRRWRQFLSRFAVTGESASSVL